MSNYLTQRFSAFDILTTLLATTIIWQGIARADNVPGAHPHTLHARSDLRKAEKILGLPENKPKVKQEEEIAAQELHKALDEIDKAAVPDRKDVDDNQPIDTSLKHAGKFQEILKLLDSAKKDISQESNNSAIAWQHSVDEHLNEAVKHVELAEKLDQLAIRESED